MLDFAREQERFAESCTACGQCVAVCPIIPMTDIRDEDPGAVMAAVLDLYHGGPCHNRAKTRVYSCMGCLACRPHCPEDLNPGLGLLLAAAVLREREKQIPRALSFLLPETGFNLMKAVEAVQIMPEQRPWITDATAGPLAPARTVLFTGCTGIMQPDLVMTALDMIRRLDPTVQALGGIDYCCGDTTLRAGRPESAREQFRQLVEGLDAFSPEEVVFLCPTCKMYFDQFGPKTQWPWHFITHYLADRLDELGPFSEVDATVTIHDACHLVRGEKGEWTSPRALLQSIPGIRVLEMENSRDQALCCGATAMASIGRAGAELRAYRLRQAEKTGAEVMAVYCPACQSIFAPQGPKVPFQIQSIISLVGRAMGIAHEDKLQHYLSYGDPQRVLSEAAHCIMASRLPEEALRGFCLKFFR